MRMFTTTPKQKNSTSVEMLHKGKKFNWDYEI